MESVRDTPVRANVGHPVTMTKSLVRWLFRFFYYVQCVCVCATLTNEILNKLFLIRPIDDLFQHSFTSFLMFDLIGFSPFKLDYNWRGFLFGIMLLLPCFLFFMCNKSLGCAGFFFLFMRFVVLDLLKKKTDGHVCWTVQQICQICFYFGSLLNKWILVEINRFPRVYGKEWNWSIHLMGIKTICISYSVDCFLLWRIKLYPNGRNIT
jgi:hypothetical protein